MNSEVYVAAAVRTPMGRFGGAFKDLGPAELAAPVMRAAVDRAQLDPARLDLVIFGQVLGGGHGQLVPRQAARRAGLPDQVDALALDMVCSSGMVSIMTACAYIRAGMARVVLAGGMESMSQAGFVLSSRARWGYRYVPGPGRHVTDLLYRDGLSDPVTGEAMGVQAEKLAAEAGATRMEMDRIATESHKRAHAAAEGHRFTSEIVPVETLKGYMTCDEGIRPDTTAEALQALRPAFTQDGVLTAGNSSQISDGAAALLLAGRSTVDDYGLVPLARVRGAAVSAGEWWRFMEAPAEASRRALRQCGVETADIDLFENNEAFALSTLLYKRQLRLPGDKLNVHGGAIALGHPIGCSGARIVVTLLHALKTRDQALGLAALCHGTGGGTALVVERC
ncbi:MAG: thiolase family protein [Bacteroidota bacterium]|nr:thiolase family protein [Bacteroidota bacterium]